MVPEGADPTTFWEHIYRYRFAASYARNKKVLDIACGEGYGSAALLAAGAASVTGVDISEEACAHARTRYGVDARCGRAEDIPMDTSSVDLVVSFETIEHIANPALFIQECARVLEPGGALIISTPNREAFAGLGRSSPFHCSEMTESEFVRLVCTRFRSFHLFGQAVAHAQLLSPQTLRALRSPWLRIRGVDRLRRMVRPTVCPHLREDREGAARKQAVPLILAEDSALCGAFNPYRVWDRSRFKGDIPVYLIAVAAL